MSDHTHASSNAEHYDDDQSHLVSDNPDSKVDAWAILILIALAVSTAVFWVSHQ